jgi:thioredoxin-like negative regulator of GroEL
MKIAIAIGVLCILAAIAFFVLRRPKPVDKSFATYSGEVADYRGGKKLVVAFTASWASVWAVAAPELRKLDAQKFDLCILDASVDRDAVRRFGITFLPTVALVENGKITKRVQNLTSIDQLRDW